MEYDLFQGMEYVYAVYQAGSFLGAAKKLMVSQPSVSASVRRVEERVGFPLFDRSVKPLRLTAFGERYIASVEQIMSVERQYVEYISDVGSLQRGNLTVGGSTLFSSMLLPDIITDFRREHPQIHLETVEETTKNLMELLTKGSIDLLLDYQRGYNETEFDSQLLQEEDIILAVPRQYPMNPSLNEYQLNPSLIQKEELLNVPPVPLQPFASQPFILLKRGNDTRLRAEAMCSAFGFTPQPVMELDQQLSSYLVSCSGIGITFVSSMLFSKLTPDPLLVYYRLGGPYSRRKIMFFWKKGRYMTRAMESFLEIAKNHSVK